MAAHFLSEGRQIRHNSIKFVSAAWTKPFDRKELPTPLCIPDLMEASVAILRRWFQTVSTIS
eukprot:6084941-Amphidinium_carterae.1